MATAAPEPCPPVSLWGNDAAPTQDYDTQEIQKKEAQVPAGQPDADDSQAHDTLLDEPQQKEEEKKPEEVTAMVPSAPRPVAEQPLHIKDAPIEALSWQQLDALRAGTYYCTRCQQPVEGAASTRSSKKSHSRLCCKVCHNVVSMLYKRWDMSKLNFKDMSADDQVDFFRKVKEMTAGGDNITVGKIRTLLTKKMVEVKNVTERAVRGKFLPLSVYEKKGFDLKPIMEKAERQKSDLFGTVYRVPILEINHAHLEESVRETILSAERKVKPQKRPLVALMCLSHQRF